MRTVVGLFNGLGEARRTASELRRLGLKQSQISVVSPETAPAAEAGDLDLDRMNVSGIGEVAACGPMMQYLSPSTAAASGDALSQALVRMGLGEQEARQYVDGVKRGYTLEAALVADDKADETLAIMQQHVGIGSQETLQGRQQTGGIEGTSEQRIAEQQAGEVRVPIVEEQLEIGKREVPAGGVRVSTHVTSQPVAEEISLREETIDVERRAVDRPAAAGEDAFREQTIEVTATAERPVVGKSAHVVEEVVVRKDTQTRTETVRDTVRKTGVDVQEFNADEYQEHFRSTYGKTEEARFDEYEPAYRYGQEIRGEAASADWSSIEPTARSGWEQKQPGSWDRFKDAIRHAWQRARS